MFEIEDKNRIKLVDESILNNTQDEELRQEIIDIINNYEGRDADALSILMYASERNRLREFMDKLTSHYKDSLQFVHPDARRVNFMPGALRAEVFIIKCFKEMDIKPV